MSTNFDIQTPRYSFCNSKATLSKCITLKGNVIFSNLICDKYMIILDFLKLIFAMIIMSVRLFGTLG